MEKVLYCFYKIILKIRANLKHHNCVYILSSKHTYRPMRVRVVAQLFYSIQKVTGTEQVVTFHSAGADDSQTTIINGLLLINIDYIDYNQWLIFIDWYQLSPGSRALGRHGVWLKRYLWKTEYARRIWLGYDGGLSVLWWRVLSLCLPVAIYCLPCVSFNKHWNISKNEATCRQGKPWFTR